MEHLGDKKARKEMRALSLPACRLQLQSPWRARLELAGSRTPLLQPGSPPGHQLSGQQGHFGWPPKEKGTVEEGGRESRGQAAYRLAHLKCNQEVLSAAVLYRSGPQSLGHGLVRVPGPVTNWVAPQEVSSRQTS